MFRHKKFIATYPKDKYVKISEDWDFILLLSLLDGRTYLYVKMTDDIILQPYWKR